jgi:hypothetical protein
VFEKEELETFLLTAPDDNEWLVRKAITIASMHGLLRKQEIDCVDDMQVFEETGTTAKYYEFKAHRGKQRGPKKALSDTFQVIEKVCARILDLYVACFLQVQ